ncbi:MAG: hypothetical protein LBQ79_08860 [Deltaproteobacteria bacterium]|jgi:4-diphosphocytidyl-2-C-methyl-D-erythritol kinase|nr:hypothetical protein [Deltaproteobacteria bacterium]
MSAFQVKVKAPAKVNLFLKVLGLRPDGRHELFCLTSKLALADDVVVEELGPPPGADVISVSDELPRPALPTDPLLTGPESLVLRCVRALREATGHPRRRVRVGIVRRIPYGAGLGGSSSDAAAAVLGLNSLAPDPLPVGELESLLMPLGADIPFFLGSPGIRLVGGAGESFAPYPGPPLPPRALLAGPREGLSTGDVFREYELTNPAPENILDAFPDLSELALPPLGANDLLPAASRLSPELALIAEEAAGAFGGPSGMSGSGPTFWALFGDDADAPKAASALRARGWWALATSLSPD